MRGRGAASAGWSGRWRWWTWPDSARAASASSRADSSSAWRWPGRWPRAAGAAAGRAALQPRPDPARAHPPRDPRADPPGRHHHRARDPRAGRGLRAGRPRGGACAGAAGAGRHAGRALRRAGQRVRGRVRGPVQRGARDGAWPRPIGATGCGSRSKASSGTSRRVRAARAAAGPAEMLVRPEALRFAPREPGALPVTITSPPLRGAGGASSRPATDGGARARGRWRRPSAVARSARRVGAHAEPAGRRRASISIPAGAMIRARGGVLTGGLLLVLLLVAGGLSAGAGAARGRARARRAGPSGTCGAFLARPTEWRALWGSLWISLASVVLAAAIGIPLAFLFSRYELPGGAAPRRTGGAAGGAAAAGRACSHSCSSTARPASSRCWCSGCFGSTTRRGGSQGAGAILLVHAYSMYVYFYLFVRAGARRRSTGRCWRRRPAWARAAGAPPARGAAAAPPGARRARRCSPS